MDIKTKIQIIISLSLVLLIGVLTYWIQLPADDLKAQLITESPTVLVRVKEFSFMPDIVRIEKGTVISWLNDETDANAAVQHTVVSYDPQDSTKAGAIFQSGLLSQGDTFTWNFMNDGVYYYNCSLHPFMTGKVCVGAASESEDADCAIETTETQMVSGVTPPDAAEQDTDESDDLDLLTDADTDTDGTLLDTDLDDSGLSEDLPPLDEPAVLTINLQGAADEDYRPYTLVSAQQAGNGISDSAEYRKTADSGPEHFIYILLALVSFLAARKYLKMQEV